MGRRASSSLHPTWVVAILILVGAAMGGGYYFFNEVSNPYRTLATLDVGVYLENSNSLKGNIYKVEGNILNSLAWSAEAGRMFSVEVQSNSGYEVLPLLVPVQFNHVNIQKGQKFYFKVEVNPQGILKVQDLRKT